jgi:MFS family permease
MRWGFSSSFPLEILVDRRRLIVSQFLISTAALVLVGLAPNFSVMLCGVFVVGVFVVGLLAVVIQVLVAFAATLAKENERGSVVGRVTSGVVIGILAARSLAGSLTDVAGWRSAYLVSAGLLLAMTLILWRALPPGANPEAPASYGQLLSSVLGLWVREPLLRVRAGLALFIFAAFSVLWTSLVLPLSSKPLSLSHTLIGMFGLTGIAGAAAASQRGAGPTEGCITGRQVPGCRCFFSPGYILASVSLSVHARGRRDFAGLCGAGGARHEPKPDISEIAGGKEQACRCVHDVLLHWKRQRSDCLHLGICLCGLVRGRQARCGDQRHGAFVLGRQPSV